MKVIYEKLIKPILQRTLSMILTNCANDYKVVNMIDLQKNYNFENLLVTLLEENANRVCVKLGDRILCCRFPNFQFKLLLGAKFFIIIFTYLK